MTSRRPFRSGHCNPGNPTELHDQCLGTYQGLPCSCSCHHVGRTTPDLGLVVLAETLQAYDVQGLAAEVERLVQSPGAWPPAARRFVAAARELLEEEAVVGHG